MTDALERICAAKREHVARRKEQAPLARLLAELPADPPRGFGRALQAAAAAGASRRSGGSGRTGAAVAGSNPPGTPAAPSESGALKP